jgi:putative DNA primase/helicase
MAWAIAGCLEWQRIGLQPPKEVIGATNEYFAQEDSIAQWLAECCIVGPAQHELYDPLWQSWREWSERNNVRTNDRKALISTLIDRGFEKWRQPGSGQRGLQGISLVNKPNQASPQNNDTATENPFNDTAAGKDSVTFGPG